MNKVQTFGWCLTTASVVSDLYDQCAKYSLQDSFKPFFTWVVDDDQIIKKK